MKHHRKADIVLLYLQLSSSVRFISCKPQEPSKIYMLDDAGKTTFIWCFTKVNYLSEGYDLTCTDPSAQCRRESTAPLVLPKENGSKGIQRNLSIGEEVIYPS